MNIDVYVDGSMVGSATITSGARTSVEICVNDGDLVDFVFVEGSYVSEISGTLYGTDGSTLGTFSGGGSWGGFIGLL